MIPSLLLNFSYRLLQIQCRPLMHQKMAQRKRQVYRRISVCFWFDWGGCIILEGY